VVVDTTKDTDVFKVAVGKFLVPIIISALPCKFLKSGKNLLTCNKNSPSPSIGKSKSPD